MTTATAPDYTLSVEIDDGDEFKRYLQGILNAYHETAYPLMEVPKSKKFAIRVTDEQGQAAVRQIYTTLDCANTSPAE